MNNSTRSRSCCSLSREDGGIWGQRGVGDGWANMWGAGEKFINVFMKWIVKSYSHRTVVFNHFHKLNKSHSSRQVTRIDLAKRNQEKPSPSCHNSEGRTNAWRRSGQMNLPIKQNMNIKLLLCANADFAALVSLRLQSFCRIQVKQTKFLSAVDPILTIQKHNIQTRGRQYRTRWPVQIKSNANSKQACKGISVCIRQCKKIIHPHFLQIGCVCCRGPEEVELQIWYNLDINIYITLQPLRLLWRKSRKPSRHVCCKWEEVSSVVRRKRLSSPGTPVTFKVWCRPYSTTFYSTKRISSLLLIRQKENSIHAKKESK